MASIAPGLDGFIAAQQLGQQRQAQEIGILSRLAQLKQQQQQMADADRQRALLREAPAILQSGDRNALGGLLARMGNIEGAAKLTMPAQPKWQITERFNTETGRAEKVMIDMNDPTRVLPFGGQKASPVQIAPSGVAFDPLATKPGTVFNDPNKMVTIGADGNPMLNPLAFQARAKVAAAGAPRVSVTTGVKKADEKFAQDYVDFATGGFADTIKQVNQLREVSKQLGAAEKAGQTEPQMGLTGPVIGNIPKGVRTVVAPQSVATQEAVEEVVQRNLRTILGAQFTEKEGERLISRAYNPALGEAENKKRVDRLIKQIETAAQAKLDASRYFMANGTLEGWKGKVWSINDFDPTKDIEPRRRASDAPPPVPQGVDAALWNVMTPEERALWQK